MPASTPAGGRSRVDPGDVSRVWFQDPADDAWHELRWEHADAVGGPFSSEALAYARQLAAATHRFPDTRRALAELLEQWGAGLAGNRAERRMALRLSEQRLRLVPEPAARRGPSGTRSRRPVPAQAGTTTAPANSAPRSPARSPATTRATSTPTRWRPCEHAAAARRARLLAVHPAGLERVRHRPAPAAARPADPRPDPQAARAARAEYEERRSVWHANLGPLRTPQMRAVHEQLDDIVGSQPAGRRQGQGRRGDRRLPRAGQVHHRPGLRPGLPPAAGQPLRPGHRRRARPDTRGARVPDLIHEQAVVQRDALPVLRPARPRQGQRRGTRPQGRRRGPGL